MTRIKVRKKTKNIKMIPKKSRSQKVLMVKKRIKRNLKRKKNKKKSINLQKVDNISKMILKGCLTISPRVAA
jgi:ribosomal protein L18E